MNVILRSTTMLGKKWRVPGNSGYCILVDMLRKKLKEERSKILRKIMTKCLNY
jgi:hypothetical protein